MMTQLRDSEDSLSFHYDLPQFVSQFPNRERFDFFWEKIPEKYLISTGFRRCCTVFPLQEGVPIGFSRLVGWNQR